MNLILKISTLFILISCSPKKTTEQKQLPESTPTDSLQKSENLIDLNFTTDTLKIVTTDIVTYFPFGVYSKKKNLTEIFKDFVFSEISTDLFKLRHNEDYIEFFIDLEQNRIQIVNGELNTNRITFTNGIKIGQTIDYILKAFKVPNPERFNNVKVIVIEAGLTGIWHYYEIENMSLKRIIFKTDYQFEK
jgi:hypothetical protein